MSFVQLSRNLVRILHSRSLFKSARVSRGLKNTMLRFADETDFHSSESEQQESSLNDISFSFGNPGHIAYRSASLSGGRNRIRVLKARAKAG
jgi:hypothetical protein